MPQATKSLSDIAADLRQKINDADRAYYVYAEPIMTDAQYDQLMKKLQKMEQDFPAVRTSDSPTQRIPSDGVDGFADVQHPTPMLSIDNVFSDEELTQVLDRWRTELGLDVQDLLTCLQIEPKIDGAAINLIYEDGRLVSAVTRGDGQTGADVLVNVNTIRAVPVQLHNLPNELRGTLEVRGEVYLTEEAFARFQAQNHASGKKLAANARNLAAGTLKLHEPKEVKRRNLSFVGHGVGLRKLHNLHYATKLIDMLRDSGVPWVPNYNSREFWTVPRVTTYAELFEHLANLRQHVAPTLPMEIDGWVLKLDKFAFREQLGEGSKFPKWAIACKLETYTAETELLNVDYQVGRTGAVTPVARLAPVALAGSTIENASLHNMDQIAKLDLRIGDIVEIQKAGKIIPQVMRCVKRIPSNKKIVAPTECPVCKTTLRKFTNTDLTMSVAIYCPNTACPAQLVESILHFGSRKIMDIDGLGDELVEALVSKKVITRLPDLYYLHKRVDQVIENTRLAKRGTEKLLAAIEKSKEQPYWRLLAGLGIRLIGTSYAQRLMTLAPTPVELLELSKEELLKQIPEAATQALLDFAAVADNRQLVKELVVGFGVGRPERAQAPTSDKLAGLTIVVTGTLQRGTRDEIHAIIKTNGGIVGKDVSKKTSLLVCGADAGSKLEKAKKAQVKVVTEDDFFAMVN